jgi:hypothetical protein
MAPSEKTAARAQASARRGRDTVARMSSAKILVGTLVGAGVGVMLAVVPGRLARADKPAPAAAAPAATCKAHNGKKCCDPAVSAHLPLAAVFTACGESDATYAGEEGSKETCKYVFKVAGQKEDDTVVQVYAPAQKEVPSAPADPFFVWKKTGKVFVTERATSPKSAPLLASATGLWLPAQGYFVSVSASTKVCEKAQAKKLAASMK